MAEVKKEVAVMRGYYTNGGYYGRYMLFASEADYFDYMAEREE